MFARFVPLQSNHSTSGVDVWETLSVNQIRILSLHRSRVFTVPPKVDFRERLSDNQIRIPSFHRSRVVTVPQKWMSGIHCQIIR